jgi:ankyrin repeat protein
LLKYEEMKRMLGGEEKIEIFSEKWVAYAEEVRKKNSVKTAMFDFSTNLFDACDRGQIGKVLALLATGQGKADLIVNDEPLFIIIFMKALLLDQVFQWNSDDIAETKERKKLTLVLEALLRFGADINNLKATDGLAPIHQACICGNSKMLKWILKRKKAMIWIYSLREQMTPLMFAAKFGHVECLAILMKFKYSNMDYLNAPDKDKISLKTALHWAANYGQTSACNFLLRIGADKVIRDASGKHAGKLALVSGYFPTAQIILGYNKPPIDVTPVFSYLTGEEEVTVLNTFNKALSSVLNAGTAALEAISDGIGSFFGAKNSSAVIENKEKDVNVKWGNVSAKSADKSSSPAASTDKQAADDNLNEIENGPNDVQPFDS